MKVVDTKEYVASLRELTDAGHEVSLVVAGNSMAPFLIHQRDTICFRRPDRPLKKGDMVFFQRENGQFVMHRILRVSPEGYDIIGDAQTQPERGVRRDQIFAVVTKANRKGVWIGPGDFWWEFFAGIWLWVIPFRGALVRGYAAVKRLRKKQG